MRFTPQRHAVCEALVDTHEHEHPSVDAIYDTVRDRVPMISRKTVYDTVYELAELGDVHLVDVGTGTMRVDPTVAPHAHFVCSECQSIEDVPAGKVPQLSRRDVAVQTVDITYRGLCAACMQKKGGKNGRT